MAKLIKRNGEQIEVEPENGKDFRLPELYKHLGCDIVEVLYLDHGMILIMDEEGKFKEGDIINTRASILAAPKLQSMDFICGDVIMCKNDQLR